jgi:signal transduction histidine kinase
VSSVTSRSSNKKQLLKWLIIFLGFTLIALMNWARFVTSELAEGESGKFQFYFIMETTGAYAVMLLLPLLLWFFNKYPLQRNNLHIRIPLYMLASMLYGASHTMLMFSSRNLIFWIGDLGAYDYGRLDYRFLMEYTHQFFSFWTVWGIVLFVKYVRENQQQKLWASQLEEQLTKVRLQALQMQLNPHFLFNTLNMISSTMYDDAKAADKMIAGLSDLLRKTLNSANWQEHSLKNELEFVNLYINIMKARFHDKLSVKMDIDDQTMEAMVPGFILQPLVENSIKYSMENLRTAQIEVLSKKENDRIRLSVRDKGPGLSTAPDQMMGNGVGLSNAAERLEKLYGSNHRFHFQNIISGGLEVVVEIPFRLSASESDNSIGP